MKKGFTLFELLAVIVIIAVISLITYSVIQKNIDVTRKSSFETSVKNLIESAKEYVVTNYEENDFPEGGIDIANNELNVKNNEFISGIIKKNEEGQIEVVNLTDGYKCANGTKNDLVVTNGSCESADKTPPTLEVKVLKKTANKVRLLVKMQDAQSGLKELRYSYANREDIVVEVPNKRSMVKKIIEIEDLDAGSTYDFRFSVKNNYVEDDDRLTTTTKELAVEIPEVEEPLFKISSGTYATTKVLTIIYPDVEGYEYSYRKGNGEEIALEAGKKETSFEIEHNTLITAYIKKDGKEVISSKLMVTGLDITPPVTKVYIEGLRDWTLSKNVYVQSTDEGAGVALRGYSIDNKKSWAKTKNDQNLLTVLEANQKFTLKTRDKVGNIQEKFRLCYNAAFTDCDNEDSEYVIIDRVDNIAPKIEISVIRRSGDKTSENNDWYISNVVTVQVKTYDQALYFDGNRMEVVRGGVGIAKHTPVITVNNKTVSYNGSLNANGEYIATFDITANGTHVIKATMKDDLENSGTETLTVKKDDVRPSIAIINNYFTGDAAQTKNLVKVTAGPSGYELTCNPATLPTYKRTSSTCNVVSGNGLTGTLTYSFGYYYEGTPVYRKESRRRCWCERTCSNTCYSDGWCGSVCCTEYVCYGDGWCGNVGGEHCENYTVNVLDHYNCPKGGASDGTAAGKYCYF